MCHSGQTDENGGGCACVDTAGMWEISEPASRLCCESKSAPKIQSPLKTKCG